LITAFAEHLISKRLPLFKEITGAHKSSLADDKKHIDFYWGDMKVDVKGLKKMHHTGYILLEFMNVWGGDGWCSKKIHFIWIVPMNIMRK